MLPWNEKKKQRRQRDNLYMALLNFILQSSCSLRSSRNVFSPSAWESHIMYQRSERLQMFWALSKTEKDCHQRKANTVPPPAPLCTREGHLCTALSLVGSKWGCIIACMDYYCLWRFDQETNVKCIAKGLIAGKKSLLPSLFFPLPLLWEILKKAGFSGSFNPWKLYLS